MSRGGVALEGYDVKVGYRLRIWIEGRGLRVNSGWRDQATSSAEADFIRGFTIPEPEEEARVEMAPMAASKLQAAKLQAKAGLKM